MPAEDGSDPLNGDHDPADFARCPRCQHETYRSVIPTSAGPVIVYVCDACDASGPRIFIPHIERFEHQRDGVKGDASLQGLLRLVERTDPQR
jgi:hypothetical protein